MDKSIFIIRHGETEYNRQNIIQGSGVDTSLNEWGRRQARAFYEQYRSVPFEVVITSALKRTLETVEPFLQQGLRWERHPELNEMGWGVQEGRKASPESRAEYEAVMKAWQARNYHARMEAGESAHEMGERLGRFVEHLRRRTERYILVCSHGRAMRALMCLLVEDELCRMDDYHHANTGLWKLDQRDGRFHFVLRNDTSHLQTLPKDIIL